MFRLFFGLLAASYCVTSFADDSDTLDNALDRVDRTIAKEPSYESTAKYCLIVLGADANVKVWMVEDGKRLFVDKNANADLTDDGPPIEPSEIRQLSRDRWDFNYRLAAITPTGSRQTTQFDLRRWNYGQGDDTYGLSLSLDGQIPMYAGWFGSFWSSKPQSAPVIHFGGALTPRMLRFREFSIGSGPRRLSMAFTNSGVGEGATSRLSIDALPPEVVPKLKIDWPTAEGLPPLQTEHLLVQRCCYWEFYTTDFKVPDSIVVGEARVSVEFADNTMPLRLTTTEIEVPVIEPAKASDK